MAFAQIELMPGPSIIRPTISVTAGQCMSVIVTIVDQNNCPIDLTPYADGDYYPGGTCRDRLLPITKGILFTVRTHKMQCPPLMQKTVLPIAPYESGQVLIDFEPCDFPPPDDAGIMLGELSLIADGKIMSLYQMFVEVTSSLAWEQTNNPITIEEIRLWCRDNSAYDNFLLDEQEYKDTEIVAAIRRVVDMWNATPPLLSSAMYTTADFPWRSQWIDCTIGFLEDIAAQHYVRNHLSYQAGGISIDDKNKFQWYRQDSAARLQTFKDWMMQTKMQLNAEGAWGRLGYRRLR